MKKKVKIDKLPGYQHGGGVNGRQMPWWRTIPGEMSQKDISVKRTLPPVPWDEATLEAEKGEVAMLPTSSGIPDTFIIGGKRHSQGGTPLNLPKESFIYSDTKDMKIKDPEMLKQFGMAEKKGGYTPAEIAKKYDINKYKQMLLDKNMDDLGKKSAELMIENFNKKLAKLSLLQESKKGFPQGIPQVAIPYIETMGINLNEIVQMPGMREDQTSTSNMVGKYGGSYGKKKVMVHFQKGGYQERAQAASADWAPYGNLADELAPFLVDQSQMRGKDEWVKGTQAPLEGGRFGDTKTSLEQFMINNPSWAIEFEKRYPGQKFDPANKTMVKEFQEFYNKNTYDKTYSQLTAQGIPDDRAKKLAQDLVDQIGFDPNWKKGTNNPRGIDSDFGQWTSSRVETQFKDIPKPEVDTPGTPAENKDEAYDPTVKADHIDQAPDPDFPAPWWLQDVVKTAHAAGNLARIRKHQPWQATANVVTPDVTFYDPTRELAANAEQANIAANTMAQFTGPQAFNARFAETQGNAARNAADILSRYNNLNVGVSNQQSAQNAAIMNQAAQQRAANATNLWDKYQATNETFDRIKAQARDALVNQYTNAITNRAYTANLNEMYPQYAVDPSTGGFMYFKDPRALKPDFSKQPTFSEVYQNLLKENPQLKAHPEKAADIAMKTMGINPQENPYLQGNPYQGVTPNYVPSYPQQ